MNIFGNNEGDVVAMPNAKKAAPGADRERKFTHTTPEAKTAYNNQQAEQIFKDTVKRLENSIASCIAALKDFRPDVEFSHPSVKGRNMKVVQKKL